MAYSTTIGDAQPTAVAATVSALPISEVTLAELQDADDAVNFKLYSGKRLGAMYCYEVESGVMEVVVAAGSEPTDNWVKLSSTAATTALTLTEAGDVADAAGITAQLNLVENAINAILDGNVITPS
jgi:hypothetical protein